MDSFSHFYESSDSNQVTLLLKKRRFGREAQSRYLSKRQTMPVEKAAEVILRALSDGPLVRYKLTDKTRLFGKSFDAAIDYVTRAGLVRVGRRGAHANGGGPPTTVYELV